MDETPSDIYDRTFQYACRVLRMNRALARNRNVNRTAMAQLVSAAMAVGASLEEAKGAQSRADFHTKVRISLKEARESHYWLRLIGTEMVPMTRMQPLLDEANEIIAILTTIARKTNPKDSKP